MQTPFQISLGEGKVAITTFVDVGGRGIIFRDTGAVHEVGEATNEPACEQVPQVGEVYVRCANRESALVLMEQIARVVAGFSESSCER